MTNAIRLILGLALVIAVACDGRSDSNSAEEGAVIPVKASPSSTMGSALASATATRGQVGGEYTVDWSRKETVIEGFLHRPIAGQRPFTDVMSFIEWLRSRPGISDVAMNGELVDANDWMLSITASGGTASYTATCEFNKDRGFAASGILWRDCPSMAGLWVVEAPDNFPSIADARPYLPAVPIVAPTPIPNDYDLAGVRLPASPAEASQQQWVITLIYKTPSGKTVFLEQQPAGLNTVVFEDWQRCNSQRWQAGSACRAWASLGAYVIVWSDDADPLELQQFEHAVDPRR